MSAPCCWSRWAARASTDTRCERAVARHRPAGQDHRHPGRRRHARHDRAKAGPGCASSAGGAGTQADGADGAVRARRGHDLRRLGRAPRGLTGNPAMGRAFDLLVERGRRLHLRGDRRADRLRAHHGGARGHARARRASSRNRSRRRRAITRCWATALRARQCRGRAHDHRGEVDGRLCQVGRLADLRPDQARRRAAARRALSARRRAGRRGRASASPTSTTMPRSRS